MQGAKSASTSKAKQSCAVTAAYSDKCHTMLVIAPFFYTAVLTSAQQPIEQHCSQVNGAFMDVTGTQGQLGQQSSGSMVKLFPLDKIYST